MFKDDVFVEGFVYFGLVLDFFIKGYGFYFYFGKKLFEMLIF